VARVGGGAEKAGGGTPALAALGTAGIPHRLHEYEPGAAASGRERDRRPRYGADTAAALGIDPARIFKTLVASIDGRLAIGIVPVSGELDLKALAGALGGRRAVMAEPAEAERATGYVVGGISPLGQRRRLPAVLDASALDQPTILVSAGRRGLQVELAPGDLARLTGATIASIARRS
jgi:Cys-tRNA(Pro)/Cys-tRNA(Cys) deacylase